VLPLDGITVVACEQAVAAPFATRQLADLGARVIKVERPGAGDFARAYDTAVRGKLGSHFLWLNRSKESVTLDVKGGAEILDALLAKADVFLANLAPGALDRLGYGTEALLERYPRLIVVNISGYGTSGPYRDKRAYDLLVQCETALPSVTGQADAPAKSGVPIADIATGMYAFTAVLTALRQRDQTGRGTSVEVSMFDSLAEWMGYPLYNTMYSGRDFPRLGLAHPSVVPYDSYPTADGDEVLIGVQNDRQWQKLAADIMGRPELGDDARYATNIARTERRAEVDDAVRAATSALTAADLVERLEKAGIPSARLNTVQQLAAHPQLAERDRWRSVESPAGPVDVLLPPMIFKDAEPRMDGVPDLGADTDNVLAELGYDADGIAALRANGTV
jgi:crotonobetainyl-CoA:carnitine CoA-transferase CaiB-like acyl-CoA transferase